jgi:hypothetical protein
MSLIAPATITKLRRLNTGDLRSVELTLPDFLRVGEKEHPIQDGMRPGAAFFAEPLSEPGAKHLHRLYTRSNCSVSAQRHLETIVNNAYDESDTSCWWQPEGPREGDTVGIRVDADPSGHFLKVHEHKIRDESKCLTLERDSWWSEQSFVAAAFSTGITPFLAHIRYMALFEFGRAFRHFDRGAHYVLVVSLKTPRQLMCHEELVELEDRFPDNFRYHPVLTREWPDDWPYTRQRIIKADAGTGRIDLSPLLNIVPDIEKRHLRLCGGKAANDQLVAGLRESRISPQSIHAEVW